MRKPAAVAGLLILVAVVRIAATFPIFSETADEALHVAAGLHLLMLNRYGIQFENPPLVPVVLAVPLLLAGVKCPADGEFSGMLHCVFYSLPSYRTSLVLARAGNLLFFALAAAALWAWARRELGERTALIALLLFTMEPIVLGYSGLATLDAGAMAGVALPMLALSRWLERRSWRRAAEMGLAVGLAVLLKFSSIPFVAVGGLAVFVIRSIRERQLRGAMMLAVVPLVAFLVVWAGYGFSIASGIPAPSFWRGIAGLVEGNERGMQSYAMGRVSATGWWWYFPLAIGLKTTLPLLAAIFAAFIRPRAVALEAFAAGAAIVAVGMSSNLQIGIRYVLPAYVCWAVAAAAGVDGLLSRPGMRIAAVVLLVSQAVISARAHPDYFPYFNLMAGRDPSWYLTDSNLDWGQDVLRLRAVVRREKIQSLGTLLMGPADLDALGFPPRFDVDPLYATAGWVAVSDHAYRTARPRWLTGRPYRRIGKSIRLYYIE